MKFLVKLNLALAALMAIGLVLVSLVARSELERIARSEAVHVAKLMLSIGTATDSYTSRHVGPLLENQMRYVFAPESIGSFAAVEVFERLQKAYPDHVYREVALNPTNSRDRVNEWEAELVRRLRAEPNTMEIIGQRDAGGEGRLFVAKRIEVKAAACLQCHGSAASAPKPLIAKYGSNNGFGWLLNETIGAQIVSLPARGFIDRATGRLWPIVAAAGAAFLLLALAINALVYLLMLRPLSQLSQTAEMVSLGSEDAPDFEPAGDHHIDTLARAFGRMRAALRKAMSMIES